MTHAWLKLADVKAGMVVRLDAGFTCMPAGTYTVLADDTGRLYLPCTHGRSGRHYLSADDAEDNLIGITSVTHVNASVTLPVFNQATVDATRNPFTRCFRQVFVDHGVTNVAFREMWDKNQHRLGLTQIAPVALSNALREDLHPGFIMQLIWIVLEKSVTSVSLTLADGAFTPWAERVSTKDGP